MTGAESVGQGLHHGVVIQSSSQLCEFCRVARSSIHDFHNAPFDLPGTASNRMQVRCVVFAWLLRCLMSKLVWFSVQSVQVAVK